MTPVTPPDVWVVTHWSSPWAPTHHLLPTNPTTWASKRQPHSATAHTRRSTAGRATGRCPPSRSAAESRSYEPTSTPWRPRSSLPRSSPSKMRCSALSPPLPRSPQSRLDASATSWERRRERPYDRRLGGPSDHRPHLGRGHCSACPSATTTKRCPPGSRRSRLAIASVMDTQRSQPPLPRAAIEVFSYSLSLLEAERSWLVARVQASDE